MNAENKLKELNDELRSLKTAFAQVSYNLVLYTYDLDGQIPDEGYFIDHTVTLTTEDGSNTIATIEGASYDRMPYEGGAKFYLTHRQGNASPIKLHSMQKGVITVS